MGGKRGGKHMSEKGKAIAKKLAEAIESLPESKREYFMGYAEGVADAQVKPKENDSTDSAQA